jgi:RimJ/RimL family protein N-acetyltransferase
MEITYPIVTERLVLRPLVEKDYPDHVKLFSNPLVYRYLYEDAMDEKTMREHFEKRLITGLPAEGEWRNLVVDLKGEFIGEVGIGLTSLAHKTAEIGYIFEPSFSGMGYATEASDALLSVAFNLMEVRRVEARLDARNTASARLAARLGMKMEAHFRENEFVKGEWTDEQVFALLKSEWIGA